MNTLIVLAVSIVSVVASPEVPVEEIRFIHQMDMRVWTGMELKTEDLRNQVVRQIVSIESLGVTNGTFPEGAVYVTWDGGKRAVRFVDELEVLIADEYTHQNNFTISLIHPLDMDLYRHEAQGINAIRLGLWYPREIDAQAHYAKTKGVMNATRDELLAAGYYIGDHPQNLRGSSRPVSVAGIKDWFSSHRDLSVSVLCVVLLMFAMPIYISFNKEKESGRNNQESGNQLFPSGSENEQEVRAKVSPSSF